MDNLNLVVNVKIGFDEPTQKFLETLLRNVPISIPVGKDRVIDLVQQENRIMKNVAKIDAGMKLLEEMLTKNEDIEIQTSNVQVETMPKNNEEKIQNEKDVPFEESPEPKKDIAPKEDKAEEPVVTLEMLRAELAAVMKKGDKEVVRQMLDYVSAKKLSDVNPKNYKLLAELIKSWKINGEKAFTK